MATKWGVAGCGKISNDFVTSWRALPAEHHTLVAAAARTIKRAEEFVNKYGGQRAYGSYTELAMDPEIEVIYVGVYNCAHFELVRKFLMAGKNVLCEKPLGLNLEETQILVALARQKKLFLMEAIWSRCIPIYDEVKRRIDEAEIGVLEAINISFGVNLESVRKRSLGGGVTLNLGIYPIQLILFAFDGEMPSSVTATGNVNEENVDVCVSVGMKFPSGKIANFLISASCFLSNSAFIAGSKGSIELPQFWAPEHISSTESGDLDISFPVISGSTFNFPGSQGLMYEAEEVRNCLKKGKLESDRVPLEDTLKFAELMQNIMEQLGSQY